MDLIATYTGYFVFILGLLIVGLLFIMKIIDYIPTPRKWLYKNIAKLAKNEPKVFLKMMIYFKRKYDLKHEKVSI